MSANETDTRDRVIRMESEVEQLTKTVHLMSMKVDEMHGLLMQARGARYVIVAAAMVGGFLSAKIAPFLPWLSPK